MQTDRSILNRRRLLSTLLLASSALALCAGANPLQAQSSPRPDPAQKTFSSRELIDSGHQFFGTISRGLAQAIEEATKRWGQPVLVENRAGANGIIAADAVAKAAPDGHMIWMGTMVQLSDDLLDRKMPFDPVKDLIPVIGLVDAGSMFVSSK